MPLTKKELAELERLEAKRKEADEEEAGYSLDVKLANGHTAHLTGAKAKAYAKRHGLEDELEGPDDDPDDTDDLDDADAEADAPPAGAEGYFRKRK